MIPTWSKKSVNLIYINTDDFYADITGDAEKWFNTSNYDERR